MNIHSTKEKTMKLSHGILFMFLVQANSLIFPGEIFSILLIYVANYLIM